MKIAILLILLVSVLTGCSKKSLNYNLDDRKLVVYVSETFMSKALWQNFDYFEARYDCEVEFHNFPDIHLALERLKTEADSSEADIICSVNSALVQEAINTGLFYQYSPDKIKFVDNKFCFDKTNHFTPYAKGYLGMVYDSRYIQKPPRNYGELQDNCWDDTLIMPDPEKTAMGRAFLHFTASQYGVNGFRYLWKGIKKNIIFYPDSYDQACKRLLAGEGHLLPGYTTQPLFHHQQGKADYIKSVILEEGSFQVTECAGILADSDKLHLAERFIDFLLSDEFQDKIGTAAWLYPVHRNTALPEEFAQAPRLAEDQIYRSSQKLVKAEEKIWLRKLNETLGRK